jgi:D-serine deaminase-like pyridoxal phosphate-dependent protein
VPDAVAAAAAVGPAGVPADAIARLPTPCLFVDVGAADRNFARAAELCRAGGIALRPHFKAHKCTTLMARQLAGGATSGVTCQTAAEALVLASAGLGPVLVANEIVDPAALDELARAARLVPVTVAVDSLAHVAALERVAGAAGVRFGVVIELDVGMGRCGLPVGRPELVGIAAAVSEARSLDLRGIQAYEGHLQMREDREIRRSMLWQVYAQVRHERQRLEDAGFACALVSGGGTGTLDLAAEAGLVGEVQAGSYVLMDARYGSLGLPFEPALFLATRVISRRAATAGVLNAGLKQVSAEYGMPRALDPAVRVIGLADEHARVEIAAGDGPAIGDVVVLVPAHVDPTTNLHDVLFAWGGGPDWERWPVDGRRRLQDD